MTDAEIGAKIGEIIAGAREAGMPDEAIIAKLTEVIQALNEGYLTRNRFSGRLAGTGRT
jgi:hypothetical protein